MKFGLTTVILKQLDYGRRKVKGTREDKIYLSNKARRSEAVKEIEAEY